MKPAVGIFNAFMIYWAVSVLGPIFIISSWGFLRASEDWRLERKATKRREKMNAKEAKRFGEEGGVGSSENEVQRIQQDPMVLFPAF